MADQTKHGSRGVRETVAASANDPAPAVWLMKRPRTRRGLARWIPRLFFLLFVAATLVVGTIGFLYYQLTVPGPAVSPVTVIISPGTTVRNIGALLEANGVLGQDTPFYYGVRFLAGQQPLQAGEFIFPAHTDALSAIKILQTGDAVAHSLTIPEGLTTLQILALIDAVEALGEPATQISGEGELLPETYHYNRGDSADDIVTRMHEAMAKTLAQLWPDRDAGLPITTPEDAIILASIVERETGLPEERPMVAGVFINRLRLGMALQTDPTIIYAVGGGQGLDRPLTYDDLRVDSPYNTYLYPGLPPGPIANPGRASIEAVLHPATTTALYFVADGNGGHAFADTLAEHNANVAAYRASQR